MLALVLLSVFGCVPAQTPPQLDPTAGPAAQVTDDTIRTAAFEVARPAGWRVITGAADQPPNVILVAPGDAALAFVSAESITNPPPLNDVGEVWTARATVETETGMVFLYFAAPEVERDQYTAVWDLLRT
ncbi:MAG: hypothetical protein AAF125_13965, partial [Chloroflexota bacterium]